MPKVERETIHAPFTLAQVTHLNTYQHRGPFHPFTCPRDHSTIAIRLVADKTGWWCPVQGCDYTQDWAWEWMARWTTIWKVCPECDVAYLPGGRLCSCYLDDDGEMGST